MKVENSNITPLSSNKPEAAQPVKGGGRSVDQAGAAASRDRAELSERARLLAKAKTALEETPDVDMERIHDLQKLVESGAYDIPFDELARLLMAKLGKE
jgi:flagellar biosynthesis anti-sigma factor FlgM